MVTFAEAIEDLYRIAVTEGKAQSPARLSKLAAYCINELAKRGLRGAEADVKIPGGARDKSWDIAWEYDAKYRLGISLKSLLKNIPGTVPNRLDDLMGEVANAQMYSPEIVLGYIMVFDVSQDTTRGKNGKLWSEFLEHKLRFLSGRRAPAWSTGTLEATVLVRVDYSRGPKIITGEPALERFFNRLVRAVKMRNPGVK
jgi:hypothetical protein